MNKDRIKDRIRKLLQTGKGATPEAVQARQRAAELMERHGIEMRLVTDRELPVAGVVGSYWRSLLLTTIARLKNCRVVERGPLAVVVGGWDDVPRVIAHYRLVDVQIAAKANKQLAESLIRPSGWAWDGTFGERRFTSVQMQTIRPILFRLLVVAVAENFASSTLKAVKSTVVYEPLPRGFKRPEPADVIREGAALSNEIAQLTALIGRDEAMTLCTSTIHSGERLGQDLGRDAQAPALRLAAHSAAFAARIPSAQCECGCSARQHLASRNGWVLGMCSNAHCDCARYREFVPPPMPPALARDLGQPAPTPIATSPVSKPDNVRRPEPEGLSRFSLLEID